MKLVYTACQSKRHFFLCVESLGIFLRTVARAHAGEKHVSSCQQVMLCNKLSVFGACTCAYTVSSGEPPCVDVLRPFATDIELHSRADADARPIVSEGRCCPKGVQRVNSEPRTLGPR